MYTFLPVLFHQAAPSPLQPQIAQREPRPAAPAAPSWPAPPVEKEEVIETKFCFIRVARGFSRKAFASAAKKSRGPVVPMADASLSLFETPAQEWPAPPRAATVELKLPRRPAARMEEVTAQPSEVGSLQC